MDRVLQEQIAYYRARAEEYDQWFLRAGRYDHGEALNERWFSEVRSVGDALDRFRPAGAILELACGTGIWTQRLAADADSVTAVDAAPEMLRLNEARLRSSRVSYVHADLFAWVPPRRFDFVFFGFWLSHVPPERFEQFWRLVDESLTSERQVLLCRFATRAKLHRARPRVAGTDSDDAVTSSQ